MRVIEKHPVYGDVGCFVVLRQEFEQGEHDSSITTVPVYTIHRLGRSQAVDFTRRLAATIAGGDMRESDVKRFAASGDMAGLDAALRVHVPKHMIAAIESECDCQGRVRLETPEPVL